MDGALLASALRFLGDVSCERIIVKMIVDFFFSVLLPRGVFLSPNKRNGGIFLNDREKKK